jgi:hypothetical protein
MCLAALEQPKIHPTILVSTRAHAIVFVIDEIAFMGTDFCKDEISASLSLSFHEATNIS